MKASTRFIASIVLGLARALIVVALALPTALSPASAQFAAQSTWIATPGGTANAITLPVANWSRNLPGVPINFLPIGDTTTTPVTVIVNGVGSPLTIQKLGNNGLTNIGAGDIRAGQWATIAFQDATHPVLVNALGQFVHASDLANSSLSFGMPVNLQINATVSTNALTVALKTTAGADPTATTPILIPFRDVTIANGDPVVVPVTAALSFTIGSTNTMGCVSGQMCRLWIVAFNNGGTVAVGAFNALSGTNVAPINEAALQTSASGTSGGSSAQTYYASTSAITAKAIRIIGYVEIQEATAGTWATGPTYTQLFGPGINRPGNVVQTVAPNFGTLTVVTTSTVLASSNVTANITPTSAANIVKYSAFVTSAANTASNGGNAQMYRGSTAIGAVSRAGYPSGGPTGFSFAGIDAPATTSQVTYVIKFALDAGQSGTCSVPNTNTDSATEILEEIMSALPESANDNGTTELRMIG